MKKFLKYFSAVVFFIVIIFFSLGIFIPSVNYESRVSVDKPVEESFRTFNNVFYLYEWVPGLEKIEWVSGVPGLAGSKWKMVMVHNGKEHETTGELTDFKNNEFFAFRLENEMMTNNVKTMFIDRGETTEIVSSNCVKGKNIFWKSVFVFAQFYLAGQDKMMYDKLKAVIEKRN